MCDMIVATGEQELGGPPQVGSPDMSGDDPVAAMIMESFLAGGAASPPSLAGGQALSPCWEPASPASAAPDCCLPCPALPCSVLAAASSHPSGEDAAAAMFEDSIFSAAGGYGSLPTSGSGMVDSACSSCDVSWEGMGFGKGPLAGSQPGGGASGAADEEEMFSTLGAWDIDSKLRALDRLTSRLEADSASEIDSLFSESATMMGDASAPPRHVADSQPSMFRGKRAERMEVLRVQGFMDSQPELPIDIPDVLPLDPQPYVDQRPSSRFLSGLGSCVRDGSGEAIEWPWESGAASFGGAQSLPKQQRRPHRTDALRFQAMDASMASGNMGRDQTGVKHWREFCRTEQTPPDRPLDPNAPLWVKLEEELLAMQFCCALVQDRGVKASTAACYFGQVQGWHAKEHGIRLASGMKLSRLPAMLKGLRRVLNEAPREVRRGVAPQALKKAMDILLDPNNPTHANIRAALSVALQGLLRSAEYSCDPGVKFNPLKHLTRADIRECSVERLILMMLPCKNMRHLSGKTCPLIIGSGGAYVDAVWEVRNMLRVDPVPESAAYATPLFRDPQSGDPLRTNKLRDMIRQLMAAADEPDPSHFGTHSLRIGGATALFAAGADETVIRTMGRWSSDCYRLYVRACFEKTLKWSRLAGSTKVTDVAGEFDEVDFY